MLKLLGASGSGGKSALIARILENCESSALPEDGPAFKIFSLLSANAEQNAQGFVLFESLPSDTQTEILSHTTLEQRDGRSAYLAPSGFSISPFFIWKMHLLANSESFQKCTKIAIDVFENCFDQDTLQLVAKRCQHVKEMRMYFLPKNAFVADDFPSQLSKLYTKGVLNEKYVPFIAKISDVESLTVIGSYTDSSLPYYDEVRLKLDEVIGKYDTYEYMLLNRVAHINWADTFPSLTSLTIKDSDKILTMTLDLPKLEQVHLEGLSRLRTLSIESNIKKLSFTNCPSLQTFHLNTSSMSELSLDKIHGGFASKTHLKSNRTIKKFFKDLSNNRIYLQAQGEVFRGQLDDSSPYYEEVKEYLGGNSEYVEETPLGFQWEGGIYIFSKTAFFKVLMAEIQTQSVPEEWCHSHGFDAAYRIQECGVDLDRFDEDGLDVVALTCNYSSQMSWGDDQLLNIDSPIFHDYQTVHPLYAVLNSVIEQVFWQVFFDDRELKSSEVGDPCILSFSTQGWLSCYSSKEVQQLLDAVQKHKYPV